MADTSQTLSLLALEQTYRGEIVRTINRRSVLLRMIRIVPGEGQNVSWAAELDGQLAENYSEGADAANFGSDAQIKATLQWGMYRSNFHVTGLARRAAKGSRTPVGNERLIARNMVNSARKLASTMNGALYAGAGTGTLFAGLDVAIGSTTNTYAGIDRTSGANASWQPYVVDPGSPTKPTLAQIRLDRVKIYEQCGEFPDVALCTPEVFNSIGNLFEANRRYVQSIQVARGQIVLEAGFGGIDVDGTIFIMDKDATQNGIYYVSTDNVEFEYLPPDTDLMDGLEEMLEAEDGYGAFPLGFILQHLSKTGDSDKFSVLTNSQLCVRRPNAFGKRLNVDPT
jgi:hypothetical protein